MKSISIKLALVVVIAFFTVLFGRLPASTTVISDDFSQPNYDTGSHTPYNVYATRMWDGAPGGGGLSPNNGTSPGHTVLGANLPGSTWQLGGGYGSDYDVDEVGNLAAYGASNIKLTGGSAYIPYATVHNYENVAISLGGYNSNTQLTVTVDVCPQSNDCYVGFDSALNVSNNFTGLRVDQSGGVSLFVNGAQVGSTIAFTGTWSNATASQLTFTVNTITGAISGIALQNSTSTYSFSTSAFTSSATPYFAFYTPSGGSALFAYLQITSSSGATTYPLTVNSGTGSGSYAAGTTVNVSANTPPSGYQFAAWTGATTALTNPSASSTTLTMPAAATSITATYSPISGGGGTTVIVDDFSQPNYDTGSHTPYNVYATRMWDGAPGGGGLSPNNGTTPGNTVLGTNLPGGTWQFGGGTTGADYDTVEIGNLSAYGASNIQLTGGTGYVPYASLHNNQNVAISLGSYHSATTLTVSVNVLAQGSNAYVGFDSALNVANNFTGLMVDTTGGLSLIVNGSQVGSTIAYTGSFSSTTASLLTFSVNTSSGAVSAISFQGSSSAYAFSTSAFTSAATPYFAFFVPAGSSGHGIYANLKITSGSGGGSPPAAPTGLAATAGNAQVVLSWTASSGATSYNIYRGTSAGGESTTAIATGVSSTTYTNTGLTNGTTYYYKVTATNSSGTSGYSNEASATPTTGVTIPAAPTSLAASPGNAQIGLSWSASSGATSYSVYRGTSAGGESTTAIDSGVTTTTYTNTGLSNGTTYYYKVTATNSAGTSGYSNEASATPSGTGTYLPATATAPTGVYSLTKLVSTYSGPAITVVRSSDSASMDIGFVGQSLDTATANSFAGTGNSLTISKVYDQSGHGNHLTQTTTSLQPKLMMVAVSTPAPPVMLVRQSEYFSIPSTLTANRQNYASFVAARFPTNLRPTPVFDMGNGTTFDFGWFTTYDNYLQQGLTDSGTETNGTARTLSSASPCIVGIVSSSSGITYHRDAFTSTAAAVTSEVMSNGGKLMACHTPYVDGRCDMFSWVFYPAALSSSDSTAVKAALHTLHNTNANTLTTQIWIQGDSITEGVGAATNITIARVLTDAIGDPSKMVRCYGKSGDEMEYDYATWSGLGSNYLEPGASNILVVWLGTNDVALGRTAAQLWSDYANYISYARAAGWTKIVGVTALPRGDLSPAEETERQSFNSMVRANASGYFNAIWDADALTASGQPLYGYTTNTALSPDHLHPSESAYQLMAPSLKATVSTLY